MYNIDPHVMDILLGLLASGLSSLAIQYHWTTEQKQSAAAGICVLLAGAVGVATHQFTLNWSDWGSILQAVGIVFTTAHATYLGSNLVPGQPLTALQAATTLKKTTPTSRPT